MTALAIWLVFTAGTIAGAGMVAFFAAANTSKAIDENRRVHADNQRLRRELLRARCGR